jgi:23S rRNA (uracil1939-C5)-methyltransferase
MPLPLLRQRAEKLEHLERALAKYGLHVEPPAFCDSPRSLGYRNRIRLRTEASGKIRFFNEHKQPSCAVLEPVLRARLETLLALSQAKPELFARFLHLELRSDDAFGNAALAVSGPLPSFSELREPAGELGMSLPTTLVGVRADPDIPCQRRRIIDDVFAWVPLDAFWQINSEVNERLVGAVRAGAGARAVTSALDLYSGAGNFSLPLAAAGVATCAIEVHAPAVRALGVAAAAQRLTCEAYAEPAERACQRLLAEGRHFELVLLDAPRRGAREVLSSAARLAARYIAVCSCNPETLAPDLAELVRNGFELEELCCFDMFPHTRHLEVLTWLRRARV